MKNIELAIQKEQEYLQEKVVNGNNKANIFKYLIVAGYDDLEEFRRDKMYYGIKKCNITPVTDSATVLQPLAYQNYQNSIPFCFFVEYDKPFALVPFGFTDDERFSQYGLDCFRCGYENGGIIVTDQRDFRFCIAIPESDNCNKRLQERIFNFLKGYYPELSMDGNDFMYDGKKVAGIVDFTYNGMYMFAINVSIIDMYDTINELGIIKDKIPGCLPHIDNLKNILKNEVESWLRV
jgi:hypothetical protein